MPNKDVKTTREDFEFILDTVKELLPMVSDDNNEEVLNIFRSLIGDFALDILVGKNSEIAFQFIESARISLEVSKDQLEKSHYAKAILEATKATESFAKAYCIFFLGLNPVQDNSKDFKEIQHKTPKAFVMLLDNSNFQAFNSYINENTDFPIEIKTYPELMKSADELWNNPFLQRMDYEVVMELIGISKKALYGIDSKLTSLERLKNETVEKISEVIDHEIDPNTLDIKSVLGTLTNALTSTIDLYMISIILTPHYNSSQYPNNSTPKRFSEGTVLTPKDYDSKLGIVRALPEIIQRPEGISQFFDLFSLQS